MNGWIMMFSVAGLTVVLLLASAYVVLHWVAERVEESMGTEPRQTFWEMLFTLKARPLSTLLITMQRAKTPEPAEHPMGSPPQVDWMQRIGFDPATFNPPPQDKELSIDLTTNIGSGRKNPLSLSMPVLIAPMGFGIALAAETKVALAQAASFAGIATSSGEGAYIPEERAYAARWILQENRGHWAHQAPVRGLADMIEVQWGQASEGGMTVKKTAEELPPRMRQAAGGTAVIHAAPYASIDEWVQEVRRQRPDCPLGIKIPASQHLEQDLAHLATLPIDAVTLDGSGGGSAGSPVVISDHFGISAVLAAHRAHQWLKQMGLRSAITLIVSGGVRGAADIARLIAVGADVVAVGTQPLLAALHGQVANPWIPVPPTKLAFARAPLNHAPRLNVGEASESAANWLDATRAELKAIIRTAGLTSLQDLRDYSPLVARTQETSRLFCIPYDGSISEPQLAKHVASLNAEYGSLNRVLDAVALGVQTIRERVQEEG